METRREFLRASALSAAALSSAMAMRPGMAAPAGSTRKIRLGVVGGGFGASFFWHKHPNCEVAAVTDLRADRRKRLRERYSCDNFYDSLEVMLQRAKNLDAVAVFTGAPDHARHVGMCMRRGLHVVSAVPTCLTLAEAENLKQIKEKTGLRYMMAETSYYRQACIYARNLFKAGGFGELFYSEVEYYHNQDLDKIVTDKSTMFYEPDGSRSWRWGYPPMLYPTHSTGFLVGVTGERIVRVSSLGWGTSHPPQRRQPLQQPLLERSSADANRPRPHGSLQHVQVDRSRRRTRTVVWRQRITVHEKSKPAPQQLGRPNGGPD